MKKMNNQLYFAYGSNLDLEDVSREFVELAHALSPVGPAILPDRALAFTRKSMRRQSGVLDIVPCPGAITHGMLFRVRDEAAWDLLDKKEGAPTCYEQLDVHVMQEDGSVTPATTYKVVEALRKPFVAPTDEYIDTCMRGRQHYNVPTHDLDAAIKQEKHVVDSLFVYGTLLRGESRFSVFDTDLLTCTLLAESSGRLVDVGDYPALTDGNQLVQGEFFRCRDIGPLLRRLDQVEGFKGWGTQGSLFTRVLTHVGMCDGRVRPAWTYRMEAAKAKDFPTIASSNWRVRRGTHRRFVEALVKAHTGAQEDKIVESLKTGWNDIGDQTLTEALLAGAISERELARHSGRWVVVP